jgi:hypothetical protein
VHERIADGTFHGTVEVVSAVTRWQRGGLILLGYLIPKTHSTWVKFHAAKFCS